MIRTDFGDAVISDCGRYRYWLGRTWAAALTGGWVARAGCEPRDRCPATFIMLNPSTADATDDDATISKCTRFAKSWGCDGLVVVNLYAFRATNPKDLWKTADPVGPDNDDYLRQAVRDAVDLGAPLVVAWGAHARPDRVVEFVESLHPLDRMCLTALRVTQSGQPGHPLYLPGNSTRVMWEAPA